MLTKKIKFKDFNGDEREETHYFNLSKPEITMLQFSEIGGLTELLDKIIESQDTTQIMKFFEQIVLAAYGEKSQDGRRLIKQDKEGVKLSIAFSETNAYEELFMELAKDTQNFVDFINAIIPEVDAEDSGKKGTTPTDFKKQGGK